ncbi:PKD domain-containing protein [Novosphingobium sp. AAP83]|uniref:PKD domain-containing protein n=1 Tax=Novosphingobium sp. AAP83 TaxID=1523425 RepID=UPI0006B8DA5C|nr:PKD domain-containing protein [Novosphingobium sp. AAP83]
MGDLKTLSLVEPGDQVRLDNSNFLAAQTYHRHQVPDASYKVWDQFRDSQGKAIYPQRKINLGPMFAMGAAGTVPSGKFNGKVIVVESLLDREAFPWQADWHRQRFDENLGKDGTNRYRIWFTENALHGSGEDVNALTRVIDYNAVLQQALRDVSAWVEKGIAPPSTTSYSISNGQVTVAASAAKRGGVQPVVMLSANGSQRAEVKAGQKVDFAAVIEVPKRAGKVVAAQWDFDGNGSFPVSASITTPTGRAKLQQSHTFEKPGTYFVTIKAFSQRQGDPKTPYARIPNLARVRVVVR